MSCVEIYSTDGVKKRPLYLIVRLRSNTVSSQQGLPLIRGTESGPERPLDTQSTAVERFYQRERVLIGI